MIAASKRNWSKKRTTSKSRYPWKSHITMYAFALTPD